MTWKSWRGGKATAMASKGCSLGTILLAGEWKTAAFARYVSVENVDPAKLLEEAMADSDIEGGTGATMGGVCVHDGDDGCV